MNRFRTFFIITLVILAVSFGLYVFKNQITVATDSCKNPLWEGAVIPANGEMITLHSLEGPTGYPCYVRSTSSSGQQGIRIHYAMVLDSVKQIAVADYSIYKGYCDFEEEGCAKLNI